MLVCAFIGCMQQSQIFLRHCPNYAPNVSLTVSSFKRMHFKIRGKLYPKLNLGRYIVGYTFGNLVLRRRASGAVKRDFRIYLPKGNFFNMVIRTLMHFCSKAARHLSWFPGRVVSALGTRVGFPIAAVLSTDYFSAG